MGCSGGSGVTLGAPAGPVGCGVGVACPKRLDMGAGAYVGVGDTLAERLGGAGGGRVPREGLDGSFAVGLGLVGVTAGGLKLLGAGGGGEGCGGVSGAEGGLVVPELGAMCGLGAVGGLRAPEGLGAIPLMGVRGVVGLPAVGVLAFGFAGLGGLEAPAGLGPVPFVGTGGVVELVAAGPAAGVSEEFGGGGVVEVEELEGAVAGAGAVELRAVAGPGPVPFVGAGGVVELEAAGPAAGVGEVFGGGGAMEVEELEGAVVGAPGVRDEELLVAAGLVPGGEALSVVADGPVAGEVGLPGEVVLAALPGVEPGGLATPVVPFVVPGNGCRSGQDK